MVRTAIESLASGQIFRRLFAPRRKQPIHQQARHISLINYHQPVHHNTWLVAERRRKNLVYRPHVSVRQSPQMLLYFSTTKFMMAMPWQLITRANYPQMDQHQTLLILVVFFASLMLLSYEDDVYYTLRLAYWKTDPNYTSAWLIHSFLPGFVARLNPFRKTKSKRLQKIK